MQNFVVQRPPRGGPGLVLSPQITQLQIVQENQTTNLQGTLLLPCQQHSVISRQHCDPAVLDTACSL